MEAMPPAGPFLHDEKGAKESAGEGFRFPSPCTPSLKRPKRGNCGSPIFGISPRLLSCQLSGGGALLRNGPAAPARWRKCPSGGYIQ